MNNIVSVSFMMCLRPVLRLCAPYGSWGVKCVSVMSVVVVAMFIVSY